MDTTTVMTLVTELHDFRRFRKPRELMAYLGLVPSEHSSGDRTMRSVALGWPAPQPAQALHAVDPPLWSYPGSVDS